MSGSVDSSGKDPSRHSNSMMMRANRILFWCYVIIITSLISSTLGAIAALLVPEQLMTMVQPQPEERSPLLEWGYPFQYRLSRPMHLLVMGVDRGSNPNFKGRSDTLLLLRIDPKTNSLNLLSIPRDTRVNVTNFGTRKINELNFLGGAENTIAAVETLLDGIAIDRYLLIQNGALTELVDLLGGLEIFVEQPMSYVDYAQNLKIELLPGWQTLSGQQAEDFVRFRGNALGDIGRIQRQQYLLKALHQRLQNPTVISRLPEAIRIMEQYIDTNLTEEEMRALVGFSLQTESKNFRMVMLPGRASTTGEYDTSYWLMDDGGRDRILREYFNRLWIGDAWDTPDYSVSTGRDPTTLSIALQNATTEPEMLEKVANYLEDKGYRDLYIISDWPHPLRTSQVIVQKGDLRGGNILLEEIDLGRLEAASTGDLRTDLTLRIGEDWLSRFPPSSNPQQ
ncbi:LCP family protein [Roseofilum casamattae]|uniref:LCP family protein n=1 Tax=Roseofilum casamattae BLCC-M143 TaxID=3022442 RepID=A0ABT7C1V7_9CYAN|nr:LCP family protein [Roseofilum casamattae]MDJ1185428.1 LCP family protein [Roseofilum casamattae BLCC-M143]